MRPLPCAERDFGDSRGVGVVQDRDRTPSGLRVEVDRVLAHPAVIDVRGSLDDAAADHGGERETDRSLDPDLTDQVADDRGDRVGVAGSGVRTCIRSAVSRPARDVDRRTLDTRSPDVNSDEWLHGGARYV